jgi:hypothetical protein
VRTRFLLAILILGTMALAACGSRTGLDLSSLPADAALPSDALAPDDGASPVDGFVLVDAPPGCSRPVETAYLLDESGVLYRYDPKTARTTLLGAPSCGNSNVAWTMTASRENAYIVYTDWTLYAVDLRTLVCSPTAFRSGQLGLDVDFGVAVSGSGAAERMFVYGVPSEGNHPILAVSDLSAFVLTKVGDILHEPSVAGYINLTADAVGNLYAFSPLGLLLQIDSTTGAVLQSLDTRVTSSTTWAQATYGSEDFLIVGSRAVGYDLASRKRTSSHDIGISPVGGGSVLTCAGANDR